MNAHRRRSLLVVLWAALAGVGDWALDRYSTQTNSAQLVLVVLVGLLIVILLEATFAIPDAVDRMSNRILGLHGAVAQQSHCLVAWNDADAVEALKTLTESRSDPSGVRAVWAPLEASADFKEYVETQLRSLEKGLYTLERYVDVKRVTYVQFAEHVKEVVRLAPQALQTDRYQLYLVPDAPFGALVIDSHAAAINFECYPKRDDVLCLYGENDELARHVGTMVDRVARGPCLALELGQSGGDPVAELLKSAKEYWDKVAPAKANM